MGEIRPKVEKASSNHSKTIKNGFHGENGLRVQLCGVNQHDFSNPNVPKKVQKGAHFQRKSSKK